MKLIRMELAEHSAAARLFPNKLFRAEAGWDIEADMDHGIVWVSGKNAQGKQGRWFVPMAQVAYGEPEPATAADLVGSGMLTAEAARRIDADAASRGLLSYQCPDCDAKATTGAGLAAHRRARHG